MLIQQAMETGVYSSRNFLEDMIETWSRLVEALDLANFEDHVLVRSSIVPTARTGFNSWGDHPYTHTYTFTSTADAWKPLPATVE